MIRSEARRYPSAAVATPHYLASGAGHAVLASGGNAVDAAVAANLVLGVVTPYMCGYGGDLLAIVWDGRAHGYVSVGRAPAAATIEGVRARTGVDEMPTFGPHSVTVPGAPRGWFALLERWGTRSFGDLAATALRHADDGFPLTRRGAGMINGCRDIYAWAGIDDFSAAYAACEGGDWLRQRSMARTIRLLAEDGPDGYYRGPVADAIAAAVQAHGGFLAASDLAAHTDAWVEPLAAPFRGVEVLELPPPTQGVTALELLRIVDGLDLPDDGPDRQHLLVEAAKLALADRDEHVGDPTTMRVGPEVLYSDAWVDDRRRAIDPRRASSPAPRPGPDGGTVYLCAADADGLLVSLIQTNFSAAGSGVHVAEWGINLQNRGASFRLDPAHVNALGPGKLPMHTLIPALALRGDAPWMVFGTMGGHAQAPTQLQVLTRVCVDGADPQAAISAPRWAVNPATWDLACEARFDPAWVDDLAARGHRVHPARAYDDGTGHAHAILCAAPGYAVATDPRAEGAALGC